MVAAVRLAYDWLDISLPTSNRIPDPDHDVGKEENFHQNIKLKLKTT